MKIVEDAIVKVEGSDTLWLVTAVNKNFVNIIDYKMGIVTLEQVPIEEVLEVVGYHREV